MNPLFVFGASSKPGVHLPIRFNFLMYAFKVLAALKMSLVAEVYIQAVPPYLPSICVAPLQPGASSVPPGAPVCIFSLEKQEKQELGLCIWCFLTVLAILSSRCHSCPQCFRGSSLPSAKDQTSYRAASTVTPQLCPALQLSLHHA